jgi:hypothetical protein
MDGRAVSTVPLHSSPPWRSRNVPLCTYRTEFIPLDDRPIRGRKPRDRRTLPRRIKTDRASKKSAEDDDAGACVVGWDLQPCSTVVRKDHVHVRAGIRSSILVWQRSSLHRTRTAGGRRRDEDGSRVTAGKQAGSAGGCSASRKPCAVVLPTPNSLVDGAYKSSLDDRALLPQLLLLLLFPLLFCYHKDACAGPSHAFAPKHSGLDPS